MYAKNRMNSHRSQAICFVNNKNGLTYIAPSEFITVVRFNQTINNLNYLSFLLKMYVRELFDSLYKDSL